MADNEGPARSVSRSDTRLLDRAIGVLVASAAGDALGVPYEFQPRLEGEPEPSGGGLGHYAPGEWSDDTQMACVIAQSAAGGTDLTTQAGLDVIADGWIGWLRSGPGDVGIQTRSVLTGAAPGQGSAARLALRAAALHARTGKTAGNGALMRTHPLALAFLGRQDELAAVARQVSALTHPDPMAQDACVLWCLAIEHAVRTGELDVRVGLSQVGPSWAELLDEAENRLPHEFRDNGWVVTALQAAWSAISHSTELEGTLRLAVQAGHDTDTVAAIAGSLAGAYRGGAVLPFAWRRRLHGWPGLTARDLTVLAVALVRGRPDPEAWPSAALVPYPGAATTTVAHPDDPGVLLGAVGALRPGVADAVVSLCRLGREQVPLTGVAPEDHAEVWLVDQEDANNDPRAVIREAARTVQLLRAEDKRVLLHCVHAHTRTPLVAAAYAQLLDPALTPEAALSRVTAVLPSAQPRPSLVAAFNDASG